MAWLAQRWDCRALIAEMAALSSVVVPKCMVIGYELSIERLKLPIPNDRHILTAAVVGHAYCTGPVLPRPPTEASWAWQVPVREASRLPAAS